MPVGRGKDIRKPEPVRRSTKGVAVSTAVMCCRILVVASTVASCTLLYWGSVCHTGCSGCCYGVLSHSTGSWHGCTLLLYKSGDKRNWQTRGPLPFTLKCIRYCDHHVILMLVRRFARSGVCARLMNCMCWNWPVVSKYMSCPRDGSVIYIYMHKKTSLRPVSCWCISTHIPCSLPRHVHHVLHGNNCTCIEDILLSIPLYEPPLVRQQVFTGNDMQNCSGNHQKHYTQKSNKKKKI